MPQSGSEFWRGPGGGQSCARSDACAGFHFSISLSGETFAPPPPVEQQIHAKNARDGRIFCGAMARIFGPENGSAWRTNFWVQKKTELQFCLGLVQIEFFLDHKIGPPGGPTFWSKNSCHRYQKTCRWRKFLARICCPILGAGAIVSAIKLFEKRQPLHASERARTLSTPRPPPKFCPALRPQNGGHFFKLI